MKAKEGKFLVFFIITFFVAISCISASDSLHSSFVDVTYSFGRQYIFYDNTNTYTNRTTSGLGSGFEYNYALKPDSTYIGAGASLELYDFSSFHEYKDLKISATVKQYVYALEDVNLNLTGGAGVDLVFREDGDFGLYFLGRLGLEAVFPATEKFGVVVHTSGEYTNQKGSWLLHVVGSAGFRVYLGGENE